MEALELPSFEDEFDRKLLETALAVRGRFQQGQLTGGEYREALSALNGVSRGICRQEFTDWLDKELLEANQHKTVITAGFVRKDGYVAAKREPQGDTVELLIIRDGEITRRTVEFQKAVIPHEEAKRYFDHLVDNGSAACERFV